MPIPNNCNDIPNDKLEDAVEKNENDYNNCKDPPTGPGKDKDRVLRVVQGGIVLYESTALDKLLKPLERQFPNGIPPEKAAEVYKKAIDNILKPGSEGRKAIDGAKGPIKIVVGVLCPSKNPNDPTTVPVPGIARP
jgi:hypothetical protein